jgi:hypothetical protein
VKINTTKNIRVVLIGTSKENGLKVNTDITDYMLMFCQQSKGQNCNIKITNRHFKKVTKFTYLGIIVTKQDLVHETLSRIKFGQAYFHSVQNILSSRLLAKSITIKLYETMIVAVVLLMSNLVPDNE